jgi:hypothetical protein
LLTAAGILLLACVVVPPANARTVKAIWGPVGMPDGSSAFPVYRRLGVHVFQTSIEWNEVAPSRPAHPADPWDPAYRWSPQVDEALRQARRNGIKLALMVKGSPKWANGGHPPQWAPNDSDYARFLTAASRRYPSVRLWMVWGEANRAAVFQPLPKNSPRGPRRYATLLRAGYRALKRRSARNIVIGGMTFSYGDVMARHFLRWMRLPNGKPPPLDWYGHNPFTRRFPRLAYYRNYPGYSGRDMSDIDTFAREIRQTYRPYAAFRLRGPRLWISEFTVSSDRPNHAFDFYVSRPEQARWLKTAFGIAHRSPSVAGMGWIGLLDEAPIVPNPANWGLLTHDGRPKPAYHAYRLAR